MNAKQLKKSLWKVPVVYVPDTQKGLYEGTVARALPPSIDVARPSPPFQPEGVCWFVDTHARRHMHNNNTQGWAARPI
jgi:hypothetical protein